MQHEVHGTDAEHGGVGVEAVKHPGLIVDHISLLHQLGTVMVLDIFGGFNDKTGGAHCWVADFPIDLGLHQFHHHTDDVAWGTELAIVAGCGHLAKDELIDITHGVAVGHVQVLDTFHNFNEGAGILNHEYSRLHIAAVGGLLAFPKILNENEYIVTHGRKHLGGFFVAEVLPAKVCIRNISICLRVMP